MFKASNPYDEVVVKATDENLTSENWQLNLDVCDKVSTEGSTGARNCVAAILKRLVHRNANVQLYSLTLSDALSKNCGQIAHQELASRSFTQTLQRIVTDRNTHDIVKKKSLSLIKEWNSEWGNDESLGLIRETMEALKRQNFSFQDEGQDEPAQVEPSSEQLRAEDEELRRVLELSLQDQGGRGGYTSSSYAGAQSTSAAAATSSSSSSSQPQPSYHATAAGTGYTPGTSSVNKSLPDPSRENSGSSIPQQHAQPAASASAPVPSASDPSSSSHPVATRVRALFDFTPTESGELAFRKGQVLRVLDSVYEHWWRGEVNGEVGIFPVNFVEVLPDPTPADMQREAEMEARIFAQANNIDRLLSKLRGLDPARDNLAEDEELQELYQSSLSMRPKIVKLIDRYNLKVNELRSMNEKFVRARSTFDAMMEQSLAKYNPTAQREDYTNARPEYGYGAPQNGGYPTTPQQAPQQQTMPYVQSGPGDATGNTPQQQQEYAQAWAAWYAQQGYQQQQQQQQSAPSQAGSGAPPLQHPPSSQQQQQQQPDVNDPGYAQWWYSQQPPQHSPAQLASPAQAAAPPATAPQPPAGYDYRQGQSSSDSSSLHDQDKRAMFERARAEAEAYHRAHQQHSGSSNEVHLH